MSDQPKPFQRDPVRRVDRLGARAGRWLSLSLLYLMVWGYAGVLGGFLALTGIGRDAPVGVGAALWIGCLLVGYQLAVQTVAWWRRRQARR